MEYRIVEYEHTETKRRWFKDVVTTTTRYFIQTLICEGDRWMDLRARTAESKYYNNRIEFATVEEANGEIEYQETGLRPGQKVVQNGLV